MSIIISILLLAIILFFIFVKEESLKYYDVSGLFKGLAVALVLFICSSSILVVSTGHTKVATLFGKVQPIPYMEGLHVVNPLLSFIEFDVREKSRKVTAGVPAEDKLVTQMEVSVQYRTIGAMTPSVLQNTGNTENLIEVHLIPKLKSILREQGKGIKQSQDFFLEHIQQNLQTSLQNGLDAFVRPKGLKVSSVLIRNIQLPVVIQTAIEETKKREQEVLKQQAELERYEQEQQQLVKRAEAERNAAQLEAQKIRELSDAEAYRIQQLNKMLSASPNYIELQKVEKWNGVLPVYSGGDNMPILNLTK